MNSDVTSISLDVNGENHSIEVDHRWTLLYLLRDILGLTGTKRGCDLGECGACTVLMSGKPVNACQILSIRADGAQITTIERLSRGKNLHPLQLGFLENDGAQCGFCTPGFIMSAVALLQSMPNPTKQEIKDNLGGNLCRCNAYASIVQSVQAAAMKISNE